MKVSGTYDDKVVAHAKVLTPSDANDGGCFSVPRSCADSIFPPLNCDSESPVQTLKAADIHGITWQFRHIYRGMPRRHLLTTEWGKFVNHKKLVAGDSVVFMRNSRGEMLIGVCRVVRFNTEGECPRWREQFGGTTGNKEKAGGILKKREGESVSSGCGESSPGFGISGAVLSSGRALFVLCGES